MEPVKKLIVWKVVIDRVTVIKFRINKVHESLVAAGYIIETKLHQSLRKSHLT